MRGMMPLPDTERPVRPVSGTCLKTDALAVPNTQCFPLCVFGTGVAVFLAVFLCLSVAAAQEADILSRIRSKAADLTTVRSDFVQETSIPMFAQPLRSKGRFAFRRPDTLLWEYVEPMREGFVLRGDQGFRWDTDRRNRSPFTPGKDPVATIIARQLIAWITFDLPGIEREYAIESLPGPAIRLKMTPLRDDVRGVIESIVITFTEEGPASLVELTERRGGKTTISFSNSVVNAPLDDSIFE